jgi:hypothetical protein
MARNKLRLTNRTAHLPSFVHGIDLIEHCLPQIPWAGGK